MSLRLGLKAVVFAIALVAVSPAIAVVWIEKRLSRSESVFAFFAQLFALVPGPPGVFLRAAYYFAALERCSWQTHVGFGSLFTHRGATMAAHVSMGSFCVLGHVDLAAGVIMASRVSIPSGKRQHFDENGRFSVAPAFERVSIGPQTWVGEGAIILANVGARCIVSAGAVVSSEVGCQALVGGNPARVIKQIDENVYADG